MFNLPSFFEYVHFIRNSGLEKSEYGVFFLTFSMIITNTCLVIIKNLGVGKFCPNSKFPEKK